MDSDIQASIGKILALGKARQAELE